MTAVLILIIYMGNQSIHQVVNFSFETVALCEQEKQTFINASSREENNVIVRKATCLPVTSNPTR